MNLLKVPHCYMRKIQWRSSHITIAGMTYAKEVHLLPSYNSRSRTFDVLSSPMTSIEITQYLKLHTQIIAAQNIIRKLNQHHVPQHLKRRRNFWHQDTMFKYGTDRTHSIFPGLHLATAQWTLSIWWMKQGNKDTRDFLTAGHINGSCWNCMKNKLVKSWGEDEDVHDNMLSQLKVNVKCLTIHPSRAGINRFTSSGQKGRRCTMRLSAAAIEGWECWPHVSHFLLRWSFHGCRPRLARSPSHCISGTLDDYVSETLSKHNSLLL